MPGRQIPLVTGQMYHVFNRGLDNRSTFTDKREYVRADMAIRFYRFVNPPLKLSRFLVLPKDDRMKLLQETEARREKLVDILCYCFMPNHFHLLLRQLRDGGISKFLANYQNSYTRYFNTKHERLGTLFLDQFKAVRVQNEEQMVHVSRYIHLNPYTSYVTEDLLSLRSYRWSSFREYLGIASGNICDTEIVLSFFKNEGEYEKFVFDNAAYQRELDRIKHLVFE
ncbi:MAG: transposase [Candidatus Blackburnbacteria bacterium]|nr:transposase [Candidatus Blackburnbacteria bacterium]